MKNKGQIFPEVAIFLLTLLWVYAAFSKLLNVAQFRIEMENQVFPPIVQSAVRYGLPPMEIIISMLLVYTSLRWYGLLASLVMLSVFTAYIALVLMQVFKRVPCSCGGILEHMGWTTHLFFNLAFIALNLITIAFIKRKEIEKGT